MADKKEPTLLSLDMGPKVFVRRCAIRGVGSTVSTMSTGRVILKGKFLSRVIGLKNSINSQRSRFSARRRRSCVKKINCEFTEHRGWYRTG
jgi:hypothetical protein